MTLSDTMVVGPFLLVSVPMPRDSGLAEKDLVGGIQRAPKIGERDVHHF